MKKIKIPILLNFELIIGLVISVTLLVFLYFFVYKIGGWILVLIGLFPLIFAFWNEDNNYGILVKRKDQPKLVALIEKLSEDFGVDCPHEILISPNTQIFVTGTFNKKIIIGIATLRNLSEGEFHAILSHEFGHFYGKDTVIGGFFWRVEHFFEEASKLGVSIIKSAPIIHLAVIGAVVAAFCKGYGHLFRLINFYYSRKMEFRADFVAAEMAGWSNFHDALINFASYSTYFDRLAENSMISMLEQEKMYINVYKTGYSSFRMSKMENLKTELTETIQWSPFNSHPSLNSRLSKIPAIDKKTRMKSATHLFSKFESLEEELTELVTKDLHNRLELNRLYQDAKNRDGICRYCNEQFETLGEYLTHEDKCRFLFSKQQNK